MKPLNLRSLYINKAIESDNQLLWQFVRNPIAMQRDLFLISLQQESNDSEQSETDIG